MSQPADTKIAKLSLRRETVVRLGVKTDLRTGVNVRHPHPDCNTSGPCTHTSGGRSIAIG